MKLKKQKRGNGDRSDPYRLQAPPPPVRPPPSPSETNSLAQAESHLVSPSRLHVAVESLQLAHAGLPVAAVVVAAGQHGVEEPPAAEVREAVRQRRLAGGVQHRERTRRGVRVTCGGLAGVRALSRHAFSSSYFSSLEA